MWSIIRSWWTRRVIPTLPTLRVITRLLGGLFLVVAILVGFKYLFFTSCLSVGPVKECLSSSVDSSSTLFAIGGILVAIVALIPTFWIEGRIRDAKKEVSQEVSDSVKEDMQRLSKAHMLIFDADRYPGPAALLIRDALIQQAVTLWPAYKQEEYRKLGMDFSRAVIEEFYQAPGHSIIDGISIPKGQMLLYISKAIFYLEETVLNAENPDRNSLVNLACMYGCAGRYEEMIRVIEKAVKLDENVKDDYQQAKKLSLLIVPCGANRQKIERLGRKIGKELPLSKDEFVRTIQKVDLYNRTDYIRFFAVKKHVSGTEEMAYLVNITADDRQGQRMVSCIYLTIPGGKDSKNIPPTTGQMVTVEELFDELDKELYVICFYEN